MNAQSNKVIVIGYKASEFVFSHESYGERFYTCMIDVLRTSGAKDTLPILASEKLVGNIQTYDNIPLCVIGQIRSHNQKEGNATHLLLHIFAFDVFATDEPDANEVSLEGYLCKRPECRSTPLGRQISDMMVAVPRTCGKSDYIPCIAWGRNAMYAATLDVGAKITISGRMQSREYVKQTEEGAQTMTAYEVSCMRID